MQLTSEQFGNLSNHDYAWRLEVTDSLEVRGMLNDDDFKTLWGYISDYNVTYIDLSKVSLKDNRVPDYAFYNIDNENKGGNSKILRLRRIILPEQTTEIGDYAFNRVCLDGFNFPKALRKIGKCAFSDSWTKWGDLVFPDGLEEIDDGAFFCNPNVNTITFPASLKSIGAYSFYMTPTHKINFLEGLKSIGQYAFARSNGIEELLLPNSLIHIEDGAFDHAVNLKFLKIPENISSIPNFCFRANKIEELCIPKNIEEIGEESFQFSYRLKKVTFANGVKRIKYAAFNNSGLRTIFFPESLEYLAIDSFSELPYLKEIYSPATTPPECEWEDSNISPNPFGDVTNYDYEKRTILYVPEESVIAYKTSFGWVHFLDVRPYDFSGITETPSNYYHNHSPIFNIQGRKANYPIPDSIFIIGGKKYISR